MSAGRRSISAPEDLLVKGEARAQRLGYANFSAYIQGLIKADVHFGEAANVLHQRPLPPVNSGGASEAVQSIGTALVGAAALKVRKQAGQPNAKANPKAKASPAGKGQ